MNVFACSFGALYPALSGRVDVVRAGSHHVLIYGHSQCAVVMSWKIDQYIGRSTHYMAKAC
jgi:hypothetical protein